MNVCCVGGAALPGTQVDVTSCVLVYWGHNLDCVGQCDVLSTLIADREPHWLKSEQDTVSGFA